MRSQTWQQIAQELITLATAVTAREAPNRCQGSCHAIQNVQKSNMRIHMEMTVCAYMEFTSERDQGKE